MGGRRHDAKVAIVAGEGSEGHTAALEVAGVAVPHEADALGVE